ncbi:hypothetical protein DL764_000580 [Monosporascus ibericus]|uniref:Uncharacterized protein n=1 Tax=Monosporascus ibericus TaxID=155417 RepID=A0A4Q4TY87_9PEZI|nr:hypothetical protein DL764_000580 [Monosporascus ibericus]
MARLGRFTDDDYDSRSLFFPEKDDLFKIKDEAFNSGTEITDLEPLDDDNDDDDDDDDDDDKDKGVEDVDVDVEDLTRLFDGNVHLPEYYRRGVEEFDENAFDDGYFSNTTEQLNSIEG